MVKDENERLDAFIGFGCLMAALALICKLFGWTP